MGVGRGLRRSGYHATGGNKWLLGSMRVGMYLPQGNCSLTTQNLFPTRLEPGSYNLNERSLMLDFFATYIEPLNERLGEILNGND